VKKAWRHYFSRSDTKHDVRQTDRQTGWHPAAVWRCWYISCDENWQSDFSCLNSLRFISFWQT